MDIDALLTALGGSANIRTIEGALTRVRVGVHSRAVVDVADIRELGVIGVVLQNEAVQVISGPGADMVATELSRRVPGIIEL